jgi:hypothetical protein
MLAAVAHRPAASSVEGFEVRVDEEQRTRVTRLRCDARHGSSDGIAIATAAVEHKRRRSGAAKT